MDLFRFNRGKICASYTKKFGNSIKSCDFAKLGIIDPENQNGQLVEIPKNTVLYHATVSFPKQGEKHWFMTNCPRQEVVWFTPSLNHVDYHNYTHLLAYVTAAHCKLCFIKTFQQGEKSFFQRCPLSKESLMDP